MTPETRLNALAQTIRTCRFCRDLPEPQRLPHNPRPVFQISNAARILICSQAPGVRAHTSGIPFADPSGVRLRAWMNVGEAEFYDASKIGIVPIGFCFPGHDRHGGDLPPRPECPKIWRARFFEALPVRPRLLLLIGAHAQAWHLGATLKSTLTGTMKAWRDYIERPGPTQCFPLPHPSWRNSGWLKRNPWFETDVLPVLRASIRSMLDSEPTGYRRRI